MNNCTYLFAAALCLSIVGCSDSNDHPAETEKPQGVIPEQQLKALEKAQGVEDMLQKAEEERRKAMEQQDR